MAFDWMPFDVSILALSIALAAQLQVITWGQSFPINDTKLSGYKRWFHESAEDQYGTVAQVGEALEPSGVL